MTTIVDGAVRGPACANCRVDGSLSKLAQCRSAKSTHSTRQSAVANMHNLAFADNPGGARDNVAGRRGEAHESINLFFPLRPRYPLRGALDRHKKQSDMQCCEFGPQCSSARFPKLKRIECRMFTCTHACRYAERPRQQRCLLMCTPSRLTLYEGAERERCSIHHPLRSNTLRVLNQLIQYSTMRPRPQRKPGQQRSRT